MEIEQLFPSNNPYYNIPILVNHICCSYYYILIGFNSNTNSKEFKIRNNSQRVEKIKTSWVELWIGNNAITNKMCDGFEIEYTIKHVYNKYSGNHFFLAFSTDKNYKDPIYSVTGSAMLIKIEKQSLIFTNRLREHNETSHKSVQVKIKKYYNVDDVFKLRIDFKSKTAIFYHGNNELVQETFNSNKIYPKLILFWESTIIEITNWKFR